MRAIDALTQTRLTLLIHPENGSFSSAPLDLAVGIDGVRSVWKVRKEEGVSVLPSGDAEVVDEEWVLGHSVAGCSYSVSLNTTAICVDDLVTLVSSIICPITSNYTNLHRTGLAPSLDSEH